MFPVSLVLRNIVTWVDLKDRILVSILVIFSHSVPIYMSNTEVYL